MQRVNIMKITELDRQLWLYKKAPKFLKPKMFVSIDSIIHAKFSDINSSYEDKNNIRHCSNTVGLLRSIRNRAASTAEFIATIKEFANCPADPKRSIRITRWIAKIENSLTLSLKV